MSKTYTQDQLNEGYKAMLSLTASVLTVLADFPDGWAPEGPLYAACQGVHPMFGMDEWYGFVDMMVKTGMVTRGDSHTLHLTSVGRELADKCASLLG